MGGVKGDHVVLRKTPLMVSDETAVNGKYGE
jgi:hypothetical protein